MALHKKKPNNFASLLIKDRFSAENNKKSYNKGSLTEFTGISMLAEKLTVENKKIYNSKERDNKESDIETKYAEIIIAMNYELSIPPRVPYEYVDKGEYKQVEALIFNRWKYFKRDKIFERNIEIWRQFWITCEKSTVICQIIDSRNPKMFFNEDIIKLYPNKKHLLFFNKSDLVKNPQNSINQIIELRGGMDGISGVYSYSSKSNIFDYPLSGTVGFIGYPNVGKSSTINHVLKQKKVKVSSTPGKTKYIQTIETPDFTLLDCPGFVFPIHDKIDLVLMGILNIDHIPDLGIYENHIIRYIGQEKLRNYYKIPVIYTDFLTEMSKHKGWIKSRCLKNLTKDFVNGLINYD